jgi:hypothetical protein
MPSRFLAIHCAKCDTFIAKYRKEGSGSLIRMYLERMTTPDDSPNEFKKTLKEKVVRLSCYKCGQILGKLNPNSSPASYNLIKGAYRKKKLRIKSLRLFCND